MCFYLKYDLYSCSSCLFKKLSPPKLRSTYSTVVGYMQFFLWYINMVLILRTQRVEKSLLEISRFNLSTDFVGVLKTHFGKLKNRLLTTAPIRIVWYIRIIFDFLEVSKWVFIEIWSTFVFHLFVSETITTQISSPYSIVVG
jgi:hypothetical protein